MTVTGRGEQLRAPARLRSPVVSGAVTGWAGPWAHDVRWWDDGARRRCARYQVRVASARGDVACIVVVEGGRAALEAVYD